MNTTDNKALGGFGKFMDVMSMIDQKLAEIAGWVVIVMMVTISYDVAMRYIFGAPTTWSFEINRYMLILVAFFGCAWALPAGGHVAVDILTEKMETRKKAALDIITSLMAIIYMLVFFYEAAFFTWEAWEGGVRSTEYLAWPLWPMRSFLAIGSFFLVFEFLFRIVRSAAILKGTAQTES